MFKLSHRAQQVLKTPGRFLLQVGREFYHNQGLLLSGAIAYYSLLSIIPIAILLLTLASSLLPSATLLAATEHYLTFLVPNQAEILTQHVATALQKRELVSLFGIGGLLFFAGMTFRVIETSLGVIFSHRTETQSRHVLVSVVLPYVYVLVLLVSFGLLGIIVTALETLQTYTITILDYTIDTRSIATSGIYVTGLLSEVVLLTSFYIVMPVGRTPFRRAVIGGLFAALLWGMVRRFLVWYFANVSPVNLIYGTFTTVIAALLTLEAAALILLLGAQLISSYERLPASKETQVSGSEE